MPERWGAQLHQCAIRRLIFSSFLEGGTPPDGPLAYLRFAKSGYSAYVGVYEDFAVICSHLSSIDGFGFPNSLFKVYAGLVRICEPLTFALVSIRFLIFLAVSS